MCEYVRMCFEPRALVMWAKHTATMVGEPAVSLRSELEELELQQARHAIKTIEYDFVYYHGTHCAVFVSPMALAH